MMATIGAEERNSLTILWRIENMRYSGNSTIIDRIASSCLYPCSLESNYTQLFFCYFAHANSSKEVGFDFSGLLVPFRIDFELSLLTCDQSPLVLQREKDFYAERETPWNIHRFKMDKHLMQHEMFVTKKSILLPHDTLTVQFRVWKSEGNFPIAEFISTCSRIQCAEQSILWPITGFSGFNSTLNETVPISSHLANFKLKFSLTCSLQNFELDIIVTADEMHEKLYSKLEVSILGNRREEMKFEEQEQMFLVSKTQQVWRVAKFFLRENWQKLVSVLTWGESLCLIFCLTTVNGDISRCIEKICVATSNVELDREITAFKFSKARCQTPELSVKTEVDRQGRNDCSDILVQDFLTLYQKHTFSDFELRSGDVSFPVHKSILCARSPVFSSMLTSEMKESNSNSLDVPDLDVHALNRMLTFLYTGTVESDLPLESAANLYYAADKYQIDSLKHRCSSILQSHISVQTASDILTLADRHQDSELISFVHDFILKHFEDVMHSEEWEKLMEVNPALAGKSTLLLCKKRAPKNGQ